MGRTAAGVLPVSVPVHLSDPAPAPVTVNYQVRLGNTVVASGSVAFKKGKVEGFASLMLPLPATASADFYVDITSITGATIQPADPGWILVPPLGDGTPFAAK